MKQFISTSTFARLIGKRPKTVISSIEKGRLPNVKRIGHHYQVGFEEFE